MKKHKISVIVPIYNSEKYLTECLDSIVNQTLKDIEIICVNDGSTDKSKQIVEKYQKKYNNIVLINKKNQGVINARIDGIKAATGEYIGFVDADDYIENYMYEKLYKLASKNKSDTAICNYRFVPKKVVNKQKWFKEYKGKVDWKFIDKNTIQWNKIVKKTLLEKLEYEKLFKEMGEGCYSIVLINANKIISTNEELYNYRVGHASLSGNFKNVKWYKETTKRKENQYNYIKNDNKYKEYQDYFKFGYLYYSLILMVISALNNDKENYYIGKNNIQQENIFKKEYKEYLRERFSKTKIIFLKYFGTKSYYFMSIATKIIFKQK